MASLTHVENVKRSLHLHLQLVLVLIWSASLAMFSLAVCGNVCIATEIKPLQGDRFSVSVAADGRIFLTVGNDKYEITSSYSYPGEKIGYHRLGTADREKSAWLRKHETSGPNTTQVHAAGKHYALRRKIAVTKN